ncbi:unnamed protein product, partial [Laminaria digitata]
EVCFNSQQEHWLRLPARGNPKARTPLPSGAKNLKCVTPRVKNGRKA